ncbi:MAG: hypothetical protein U0792_17455 [Gemmataceae bacterium]
MTGQSRDVMGRDVTRVPALVCKHVGLLLTVDAGSESAGRPGQGVFGGV